MIKRYFLFKTVQEGNEELTKNNEGFLVDFSCRLHEFFKHKLLFYWWMVGYITEDEVLGINLVDYDIYCLDQIIE